MRGDRHPVRGAGGNFRDCRKDSTHLRPELKRPPCAGLPPPLVKGTKTEYKPKTKRNDKSKEN